MTLARSALFRLIPATGFSLMRIAWALVVLAYEAPRISNVTRLYGLDGLLPPDLAEEVLRSAYRFSLLEIFPGAAHALFALLLLACVCMVAGVLPRAATVAAILLLFSFHERNPLGLGGGDTMLRLTGLLLALAPVGRAFSRTRLREQWRAWRTERRLLPPATMEAWPQILLTWQLGVIYVASAWDKLLGTLWPNGSAVAVALHHPHFSRLPPWAADWMAPLSPALSFATLAFELSWLLLILPRPLLAAVGLRRGSVKRALLAMGTAFHLGIFALMDVGSFSWAMLAAFLGTLDAEDFAALRGALNGWRKASAVTVLYDGRCGLCQRSVFVLALLDNLHRLRFVDFHDEDARRSVAPDLPFAELDRALHIRARARSGAERTRTGFDGLRILAWRLPPLWPVAPFLHLPGVAPVGRAIYALVAARRARCTHERCLH